MTRTEAFLESSHQRHTTTAISVRVVSTFTIIPPLSFWVQGGNARPTCFEFRHGLWATSWPTESDWKRYVPILGRSFKIYCVTHQVPFPVTDMVEDRLETNLPSARLPDGTRMSRAAWPTHVGHSARGKN